MKAVISILLLCSWGSQIYGQVPFTPASSPGVGSGPKEIVVADVHGTNNPRNLVITQTNNIQAMFTNLTPCDPHPSGIVAWWRGEGDANDVIGTNNGVIEGGLQFATGEVGQAFLFSATNEDVKVPASQSLNVGVGNGFTLEAWINCTNVDSPNPIFEWNVGDGVTQWGVHFYVGAGGPGSLYANVVDSTGNWHNFSSAQNIVASNLWQHAALTYDEASGTATIYCNGAVVAQSTVGSYTPQTSYNLYLGRRVGPDAYFTFAGLIDEPSVYDRALSSNEIAAIYQAGSAGKCFTSAPPQITVQPLGQTNIVGLTTTFSISASGTPPLYYQWRFNGTNFPGATNNYLGLTNLLLSQSGSYDVVVTNYVGSVTSTPAQLDVVFIEVEVNGQPDTGTATAVAPATITILGGYPNGYLFYTLDGSTPTTSSTLYTGPFALTNSAIVSVLSVSSDFSQQTNSTPVTVQVIPTYSLQTSVVGNGTLSTNPPGGVYASNTVITLTAAPALHWSFAYWAGDTNGTQNPLSVTMNGPHNIQAVFVQTAFPLTLAATNGGTVTANGMMISPSTYYPTGTVVTLVATPNIGWSFVQWQGTVTSTNNPLNLVINQTNNIQAIFTKFTSCDSVPSGIVSWWQGQGNANDIIGTNNGILEGGIEFAPGEVGLAFLYNNLTNDVRIPAGQNLDLGAGTGFTLEAWINCANVNVPDPIFEWDSAGGSDWGVHFYAGTSPGALYANVVDSGSVWHTFSSGNGVVTSNVFEHVALTYDKTSGMAVIYCNGTNIVQANVGSYTPLTSFDLYLGRRIGSGGYTFAGMIDEPSIYNRALSQAEIQAIYNAGSYGKCFTPTAPTISFQPVGQTNVIGSTVSFSVTASGTPPLYYQWQLNGTNLPAATNSSLVLSNLALSEAGSYDVLISNYVGSITSNPALLDVQFIQVEVNGQVDTGTNTALSPVAITLLGGYPGGYLFYTLDGSVPATSSTLYTGPFSLTNSAVLSVLAVSSDFSQQTEGTPLTVQVVPTYRLLTSIVGSGTLATSPAGDLYASNSLVTLTATASAHWSFVQWAGDTNSTQNPLSLTMNSAHSIQAVFVQNAFPLTLTTPGGGTVKANGAVIGASTYYPTDSVVSLTATPFNGWVFLGWQGIVGGTNNPLNLVITQTNNIQAIFGTIVATNAAGGAVVLSQPNPVPYGTALTISAVPNSGNYFVNWAGNLSGISSPTRSTVTTANPTFGALFTPLPAGKFSLAIIVNGPGLVSYSPPSASYYSSNAMVSLTPSANTGNYFFGWTLGASGRNSPLTVQITSNTVIQANFGVSSTVSIAPLNQTVVAGSNAVLNATALGLAPLFYQWQSSQGAIPGATNTTYTILNTQPTNAGGYFIVVSNSLGSVTSAVATVSVIGAPAITNQPASATVVVGHTASFIVGAFGAPSLAYQWQLDGASMPGATSPTLILPNAFPTNSGTYTVIITNAYGSATSYPAMLTVLPLSIAVPAKLVNGQFQITFDTAAGVNYDVEYSTNLLDWYPWLNLGGNGQPLTLSDPNTIGTQQRFYRIVLLPQ